MSNEKWNAQMDIVSLLDERTVIPDLEASTKEEVLDSLISTLSCKVPERELEVIREAVFERESIMSTGVGKGLAIPHGKAREISGNYAAFALLDSPVEYNAIDGQAVSMVFLLAGPETSNSFHIKMLSRISRLMNNADFRDRLMQCGSAEEIIETFRKEEQAHFGS